MRFQGLFTPLLRVLFTFPLRYWFAIGLSVVFRLSGWCRQIQTGFLQPRPTQDTARPTQFVPTGLSPAMAQLSRRFSLMSDSKCSPTTPRQHAAEVWALPVSLATTQGIIVIFFSSPYLDVSVQEVPDYSCRLHLHGLPHSDTHGLSIVCISP